MRARGNLPPDGVTARPSRGRRRAELHGLLGLFLGLLAIPAFSQDEQTKELMEKEKRYYEQQMQKEAEEPDPATETNPEARREAQVQAFLKDADRLIRDRDYDAKTSEHYRIQTDDPRLSPVAAASLLESFRTYFGEFWGDRMALHDDEAVSRIFLFYSYFKYNQLLTGKKRFDEFRSSGHYRPYYDVVVLHTDSVGAGDLADTLVHEAAHQLIGKRLYGGAEQVHWVAEGMAAYFGFTAQDPEGKFRPGAIGGKGVPVIRGETRPPQGGGVRRLEDFRRLVKKDEAPSVIDLVAIEDPAVFYGERIQEHYTASWLLVHYLLHGDEGALVPGFVRFLESDAEGPVSAAELYVALGRTPEQLEEGFRSYVVAMKKRPSKRG